MTHETINPAQYDIQLDEKKQRLTAKLAPFFDSGTPPLDVYASPKLHYRMRAEFRVWHEGDDLYYIMFDPQTREKIRIDTFLPGSQLLNRAMHTLRQLILDQPQLRQKLFQVDFLTSVSNEIVISLLYHRQLDEKWEAAAEVLQQQLTQQLGVAKVGIIGRARKQKKIMGEDFVTERLVIDGRPYLFTQVENSFTQPNAAINVSMLEWALAQTATLDKRSDLLELYCGNGNFSLPLAQNFRRVLATEISKVSVHSARDNIRLNQIDNVTMLRMSAEEFSAVMRNELKSQRADEADVSSFNCKTVLVDPPRAGLDDATVKMVQQYDQILYISCNPDTLVDNLAVLSQTHRLARAALFDQFPYTEHMEAGVWLERRGASA